MEVRRSWGFLAKLGIKSINLANSGIIQKISPTVMQSWDISGILASRVGEFRNTQVGDNNWLSAFSNYTMLWESPQKISDLKLSGRASHQHPWKYKGNFRKYKENYSVRYFFIFLFTIEYLNNFRALGFILEVLTELLTPISIYFMYFICHLS